MWGISEMVNGRSLQIFANVLSTPGHLHLWGFLELYEQKKTTFEAKIVFLENAVWYLRNGEC